MENETEVWLRHPEIDGIEVSSFGRVRTLDRTVLRKNGTYPVKGRVLTQHDTGNGYLQVNIRINGKRIFKLVHRLVAQIYIPNPDNLPQVNHLDCDRTNNNVENLEFCTASYNQQYREKYGISNTELLGNPVFAINLDTLEVLHFRSQGEAGRELGVFQQNIYSVLKGKRNHTHGFWFTNADDKAVDLTKQKLRDIDKTRLTATDSASADFVSRVLAE